MNHRFTVALVAVALVAFAPAAQAGQVDDAQVVATINSGNPLVSQTKLATADRNRLRIFITNALGEDITIHKVSYVAVAAGAAAASGCTALDNVAWPPSGSTATRVSS